MAKLSVSNGDIALIDVKLSFTGTVRNHVVTVENQHIPTVNNEAKDVEIVLDGDPVRIRGRFVGSKGSVIDKFEVGINGVFGFKVADIKFKYDEIEITVHIPYSKFNLKEKK
ncbi:MAG: hypothetical protein DI539_05745 [Flavobacterium psychrophilum]|nr:MAG: hypothetical protein DI539_05745 [Flavobacterium psychrophilum]